MAEVFISHADEEKNLAGSIERMLKEVFEPNPPSIFLSSNIFTLTGGESFETRIRTEIEECSAFVAMCSEKSFSRHWLHVESGAAWAYGKPVIPLCYGGKSKGALPRPYSSFQALDLIDPYTLVIAIGKLTARAYPPPPPLFLTGPNWSPGFPYAGPYEQVGRELKKIYPNETA